MGSPSGPGRPAAVLRKDGGSQPDVTPEEAIVAFLKALLNRRPKVPLLPAFDKNRFSGYYRAMGRWLRRLGLALSCSAYALLAFHVDHADADHASPAHHCCPCHFYSTTPNVSAAISVQAASIERLEPGRERSSPKQALRSESAPRAPPVA